MTEPIERFMAKVEWGEKFNGTRCLIWTGAQIPQGYGSFWDGERRVQAHRWLYERWVGPIPDGLVIDHLCRVQLCVNPDHLEAVTQHENVQRGNVRLLSGLHNKSKTHCPQGHPYDEENTYVAPQGDRRCRTCRKVGRIR